MLDVRRAGPPQASTAPSGGSAVREATSVGASSFHPRDILLGAQAATGFLPVCDHYSGVEARMRKSLQLQADMLDEFGACVFDVTLDCEDGAPAGGEADHAAMVVALAAEAGRRSGGKARVAVRVHAVDHPSFEADMATVAGRAGHQLCHIMVPKVESVQDVDRAEQALLTASAAQLPLHVLIESPGAVHQVFDIAAHARVQSVSFGLMDFVSSHGGAIPASGMSSQGQFTHPLVVRAKLEIASACHAYGKTPSHGVVTEFTDLGALAAAARQAAQQLGYTRMWSIHPSQIRPILAAFSPTEGEIEDATKIIAAAEAAQWAPIGFNGKLHDRASYRYFWQVLVRAHQTGCALPAESQQYFSAAPH